MEETLTLQKRKNGLAVAGFIVALIGLILSWIPLVNIFGIWLCGIGFLLSLVGLFLKGRKKGMAIAGLLVAIAGVIVFYSVYATLAAA